MNINSLMGQTPNSFTPLILACQKGEIEIVKLLLESGADVNLVGDPAYKTSPLSENCREGNADICNLLLSKGANKNHVDAGGWTPLKFAEEFHHTEIITLLTGIDEKELKRGETLENQPKMEEVFEKVEKMVDSKLSNDFECMHNIIFNEKDEKVSFLIRFSFMFTMLNMLEENSGEESEKLINTLRKKMGSNDPWENPAKEDLKKSIESIKYLKTTYPDFAKRFYMVFDMWLERINKLYKCEEKISFFEKIKMLLRF